MKRLFKKWTDWLHDGFATMGDQAVSAYRIFYALTLLFMGPTTFAKISRYAPELYNPKRSLAIWFDLPDPMFFQFLDWLILVCLVLLLFGIYSKWTSLLLGIAFIVGNSFLYSFDKINHGNLLVTFVPLIMAFSNWDAHFSFTCNRGIRREVQFWPVSLMAFIIGFGMFTAGVIKLISGWLNPNYQAIKFHVFKSYLNLREGVLTDWIVNINSLFFWEAMDYIIIVFEIGFFIAVFWKKWYERWIVLAIFFHMGVLLVLDISFDRNIHAYFLFLDWFFILHILRVNKLFEFVSKGFNLIGLFLVLGFFVSLKVFFGSAYLMNYFLSGKLEQSAVMFGLSTFVIVGSAIYRLTNRNTGS